MKYAMVNNVKREAKKGIIGYCQVCSSKMIAKIGEGKKIPHWAHKSKINCDHWWENETEWHRVWKNKYPIELQEVICINESTGEKHIADILTKDKITIEFQNSFITEKEQSERELFYKNIIWVVNCKKTNVLKKFSKRESFFEQKNSENTIFGIYKHNLKKVFPKKWVKHNVPIVFDYIGKHKLDDSEMIIDELYCLLPKNDDWYYEVAKLNIDSFIKSTITGKWQLKIDNYKKRQNQPKKMHTKIDRKKIFYISENQRIAFEKMQNKFNKHNY
jgi:competence protein CoiA